MRAQAGLTPLDVVNHPRIGAWKRSNEMWFREAQGMLRFNHPVMRM